VAGDSNMYYFSGGITTYASCSTNTITKQGTTSWAEEGFLTSGTTTIRVLDDTGVWRTLTYTGGETTTTLTGVTQDPTSYTITAGNMIIQGVRTSANTPASAFDNDLIEVLNNQVYVGDLQRRDIYVSTVGNYTTYTYASPRTVGEGALLTLDECPTAFVVQEDSMYISTRNQWYLTNFTLSEDIQNESLTIKRLLTSPLQGAINQGSVLKAKADIYFVSNEPSIDSLGRVENIPTTESASLSSNISNYLNGINTANCQGMYWRDDFYFTFPEESIVLKYDIQNKYWEAPLILPVSRFAIIDGWLCGHSNSNNETYKLFDGYNDNGNAIEAIAKFSYLNYGNRHHQKNFTEWFTEGYIASNTVLNLDLYFDYDGYTSKRSFEIDGNDDDILFKSLADSSLGKNSLGKQPLGTTTTTVNDLNKFREIETMDKDDFFEIQPVYYTNDIDQKWEILCFGGDVQMSTSDNSKIKK
jgi:hypothetical protein